MAKVRITRRIQLNILGDTDERKAGYSKLYQWNDLVFRAANQVVSHLFFQSKQAEFSYLSQTARLILLDENVPAESILDENIKKAIGAGAVPLLNTSKQNSTYRVLSEKYKGKLPSDIFNNVNNLVSRSFNSESELYYKGERSLRSYKKGFPIPFSERSIKNLALGEGETDYTFTLFGIRFRTNFGKDKSRNKEKIDLASAGKIKLCNSSIQLTGRKVFLLAVFEFEAEKAAGNNELHAKLASDCVILAKVDNQVLLIGEKEELIHHRKAMDNSLRRAKQAVRLKPGGKGKKYKTKDIERIKEKVQNYWQTKMHEYSKKLIDLCVKHECSKLVLASPTAPKEIADQSNSNDVKREETLLPDWTYHGLSENLAYKCNKFGIKLVLPEHKL